MASGLTAFWAQGARCIRPGGEPLARWQSQGGTRVLVVATHPDDEIGCAGTLLRHARAGDEVHVAHVTDGRRARLLGVPPDAVAALRRREAAAAGTRLAATGLHWIGLREGAWDEEALATALRELLRSVAPQVLYAPSRIDFHPEHIRVAAVLGRLLASWDRELTVRVYEIQVPLTPVLANLVTPLGAVGAELRELVACYPTQVGSLTRCLRMKRYAAALHRERGLVEVFWELSPQAYARAVEGPPGATFRGVRQRPFTDPLAYLQGRQARRALRERVERA
ncbi:MAG TPA: PIG-L family deacetylase [Gemmatimonadales bacterium]|nr:PIG-L family deacetylase [Gemmatimonadales bacterium]